MAINPMDDVIKESREQIMLFVVDLVLQYYSCVFKQKVFAMLKPSTEDAKTSQKYF